MPFIEKIDDLNPYASYSRLNLALTLLIHFFGTTTGMAIWIALLSQQMAPFNTSAMMALATTPN